MDVSPAINVANRNRFRYEGYLLENIGIMNLRSWNPAFGAEN